MNGQPKRPPCPHSIDASGPRPQKAYRGALGISAEEQKIAQRAEARLQSPILLEAVEHRRAVARASSHCNTNSAPSRAERIPTRATAPSCGTGGLRRIDVGALFLRGTLSGLTRIAYCKALDDERRKRRQGEEAQRAGVQRNARILPISRSRPWTRTRNGRFDRSNSSLLPTRRALCRGRI